VGIASTRLTSASFPSCDGVMAKPASDDLLTSTTQRSGLNFHPLCMSCWCVVCEAANLSFPVVDQPADTILWCMAVNKWLVLVRHYATMAKAEPCWLIESLNSCSTGVSEELFSRKSNYEFMGPNVWS
jgi:hypothetical protein